MKNEAEVDVLLKCMAQLQSLHHEISQLAKKSPNDGINKFKLKFVNSAIGNANAILKGSYTPFEDFTQFDVDELPSNSDVTLILAQYIEQAERYRSDNVISYGGVWWYVVKGAKSEVRAKNPTRIGADSK